ncbi:hypothetical protein [Citricoccus sp. NR2]|uniref:hypothetical protein n=1 Tax=Citricoccus sp. NR2 TaxID=3004095 RepID=UPI0022DD9B5F|nr:hypothetical protein [Citricoccus sp. NR2]WBL19785.1 hypothetical protein O1A05_03575 [Citricoccus sp. NR2]
MNPQTTAADFVDQSIGRGLRDGVEIHRAALAAGLSTRLYPRQVLEVYSSDESLATAFTHGLPQASTLSGVTFTQDLRMGRGLLEKAGIRIPRGATFSVGYSRKSALRYGEKHGYPVVVKPALGDSTIDVVRGIQNQDQLRGAIETLLTPPEQRPDSTQASYGITELRKAGMKKGKVTVPPGYRFYVQEEVEGDYVRLLVLDGEIIDVLSCPGGPWARQATPLDEDQWPQDARALAAEVSRAIPGVAVLSVDVVVPAASSDATDAAPVVVEVSERPWLEVQHGVDPERAHRLAGELLRFGLGADELPEFSVPTISPEARFFGVVDTQQFTAALGHVGSVWNVAVQPVDQDETLGRVAARLEGDPGQIAEMIEVILDRGAQGQVAMRADLDQ